MNLFRSDKAERVLSEHDYARLVRMTLDAWAANGGAATEDGSPRLHRRVVAAGRADRRRSTSTGLHPCIRRRRAERQLPPQLDAGVFRVRVPTLVIWGERDEALLTANLDGLDARSRICGSCASPTGRTGWCTSSPPRSTR